MGNSNQYFHLTGPAKERKDALERGCDVLVWNKEGVFRFKGRSTGKVQYEGFYGGTDSTFTVCKYEIESDTGECELIPSDLISTKWDSCKYCVKYFPYDDDLVQNDELASHVYHDHSLMLFDKEYSFCERCEKYITTELALDHLREDHPEFYRREVLPVLRGGMRF